VKLVLAVVAEECLHDGEPAPAEAEARPALDPDGLARLAAELERAGARQTAALSLNAQGQLAPAQRAALVRDLMLRLAFGVGLLLLAGWLAHELLVARGPWLQISWALLVVAVSVGAISYLLVPGGLKEVRDLAAGLVRVEEGWVTKCYAAAPGTFGSARTYFLQVNQRQLIVPQATFTALPEGRYRLYALPTCALVVNIDPIGTRPEQPGA